MKKLMIAAAVVCAAVASQAAAFTWSTSANAYTVPAGTTLVDGQKYDAGTTTMKSVNTTWDWTAQIILTYGTENETIDVDTIEYNISKIKTTSIASDLFALPTEDGQTKNYAWSIVITGTDAKGNTLVSDAITGNKDYSKSSSAAIATAAPAKWTYHAAAVPEPTSGLLLLLGVAGMALRRRRA